MNLNIFGNIPTLDEGGAPVVEVDPAEAKADRIKFHRQFVRNGPANFKVPSNGQAKRARVRALARETKRARRNQVQNYFQTQLIAAKVRGQLTLAGLLPSSGEIDRVKQVKATVWLVQRFGEDEIPNYRAEYVRQALASALKFYGQSVGQHLILPPDYILPIYEIED